MGLLKIRVTTASAHFALVPLSFGWNAMVLYSFCRGCYFSEFPRNLVISNIRIDIPLCYVGAPWGLECRSDTCCCTLEIVLSQHLQIESVLWKSRKIPTCFGLQKRIATNPFPPFCKWFQGFCTLTPEPSQWFQVFPKPNSSINCNCIDSISWTNGNETPKTHP